MRLVAPAFGDFLLAGVLGFLFGAAFFVPALMPTGLLSFFRACVPVRLAPGAYVDGDLEEPESGDQPHRR